MMMFLGLLELCWHAKVAFCFGVLNKMKFPSCSPENLGHSKSKPQCSGVFVSISVCSHRWQKHEMPLQLKKSEREGYMESERDSMIVVMKRNERNQSMWHVSSWTCSSRYGQAPDQYVATQEILK